MNYALFEKLCKAKNTTPTAITQKLGLSKGNASSWKKGGNPSAEMLSRLADELNCTTDELLGRSVSINLQTIDSFEQKLLDYYNELDDIGKGSVLGKAEGLAEAARAKKKQAKSITKKPKSTSVTPSVTDEPEQTPENDDNEEEKYIYLDFPALPASAGTGVYIDSDYTEPLKVRADELTCEANYALRVSGNSMQPRYFDGDIVLVQTQPCVDPGEIGIFIYNDEAYIKQFGGNRLISINPDYDDIQITDPDSCYCKGKVIGILEPQKYL